MIEVHVEHVPVCNRHGDTGPSSDSDPHLTPNT